MIKGRTNNPNGRPPGTPNKITADLKAFIVKLITDSQDTMASDLRQLEPYQRLVIIERLMRYVITPGESTSINDNPECTKNREDFLALCKKIREKAEEG